MSNQVERPYAVGVDVGGTKVAAAVVDRAGKILHQIKLPVVKDDIAASISHIAETARRAVRGSAVTWEHVEGVGVCVPGVYFAESGAAWAPNLWGNEHVALGEELAEQLAARIVIDSDRAAYVLGEQWLGVARGLSDVVFVAVGTGIGAGIITGGKLCRGAGDIAGAVGWFVLDPRRSPEYELAGCFESEAAGPAIARKAVARITAGGTSSLCSGPNYVAAITTEMVVKAAHQGDALARKVLREAAQYLGMGVANIISILNPQAVVLGGGLMNAGDLLLEPLKAEAARWAQPLAFKQVRIELTRLGDDAGVLGAARLAFLASQS